MNLAEEIAKREDELQQLKELHNKQVRADHARTQVLPKITGNLRSFVNEVRTLGHLNTTISPINMVAAKELVETIPDLWADTLASTLTFGAFYGLWEFSGVHKEMGFDLNVRELADFDLTQLEDVNHPLFRACATHIQAGKVMSLIQRANRNVAMGIAMAALRGQEDVDGYYAGVRQKVMLTDALQGINIKKVTKGTLTWEHVRYYDEILIPEAIHRDCMSCKDSIIRLTEWYDNLFKLFDNTYA